MRATAITEADGRAALSLGWKHSQSVDEWRWNLKENLCCTRSC